MTPGLRERDQDEVGAHDLHLLELLEASPDSRTWLAADGHGQLVVVHRLGAMPAGARAAMLAALERAATLRHPALLPPSTSWEEGGAVWVARPHAGGVSMRRLVAVARLTPQHVAAIALDMLAGLAVAHGAGVVHGRLHPGNVLIGVDGRARIADMGLGRAANAAAGVPQGAAPESGPPGATADIEAVAAIMAAALAPPPGRRGDGSMTARGPLVDLITGSGAWLGPTAAGARDAILAAAGEPSLRTHREIAALAAPLSDRRLAIQGRVLSPAQPQPAQHPVRSVRPGLRARSGERARALLAESVRRAGAAWAGAGRTIVPLPARLRRAAFPPLPLRPRSRGEAVPPRTGGSASPGGGRPAPPVRTHPPHAGGARGGGGWTRRRAAFWVVPIAAAFVVTAVVTVREGGGPGTLTPQQRVVPVSQGRSPQPEGPSSAPLQVPSPSAAPVPAGARSAPPAPPSAAGVQSLSLGPSSPNGCVARAGTSCSLRVEVHLTPRPSQTVAWEIMMVDACTGAASTVSGASVPAGTDYEYVWGDSSLTFASGDPVTLYAVTTSPGRAASPAMNVSGASPC